MKKVLLLFCHSFIFCYSVCAQKDTVIRKPSKIQEADLKLRTVTHSIKIENQSFWLDGRLIPTASLPPSLQSLPVGYSFSLRLTGVEQFKFCVLNNMYMYANKKIIEIQPFVVPTKEQILTGYYQDIKKEDPETFEKLTEEASLEKKSQELAIAYNSTPDKQQKAEIEAELEKVLEALFELKIKNTEREIIRLQGSVDDLRKKLSERRKNKEAIIQKRMSLLLHKEIDTDW